MVEIFINFSYSNFNVDIEWYLINFAVFYIDSQVLSLILCLSNFILSICLWLFICQSIWLPICVSKSVWLTICVSQSISLAVYLHQSVSLAIYQCISPPLPPALSLRDEPYRCNTLFPFYILQDSLSWHFTASSARPRRDTQALVLDSATVISPKEFYGDGPLPWECFILLLILKSFFLCFPCFIF